MDLLGSNPVDILTACPVIGLWRINKIIILLEEDAPDAFSLKLISNSCGYL
jgi:hypothetical protein